MKTKEWLLFLSTLFLSAVGLIVQGLALNSEYEADGIWYKSGPFSTVLSVVTALGICLLLVSFFILRRKGGDKLPVGNYGVLFFGLLAGLFAADDALFSLLNGVVDPMATTQVKVAAYAAVVCAVPFAAYFIYMAFFKSHNYIAATLLGMGGCLYGVAKALILYFDMSYALSSGIRIYNVVATLVMVMFMIAECKYHAAEGVRGTYFTLAFAMIFFACAFSAPMFIYSMGTESGVELELLCVQVAVGGYALSRIFTYTKVVEEEEMEYTFKYFETLDEVNWEDVPKAMVDKFGWGYDKHQPLTYARGVYAADTGLVVKLTCHEENPRATLTEFMDDVCNDSCMEFFFAGDNPEDYANFEFNALGTQHTSLRKGQEKGSIDKFTEIPYDEAKIYDDRWELTLTLTPKNVLDVTGKELERGATFRGNFYKCGDQCEVVHYGMWSEVKTEKPSFHQPAYFGKFIVG